MKKVVLITGASGGMGAAAAKLFAKKGWQVVAGARTVEKIPKDRHILAVRLDVTDSASNQEFIVKALEKFDRIDVLINNAGYGEYGPTEEISMADARHQFDVNYFAAVELSNLVLPTMRKQNSGRIVNISSIGGDAYTPLGAHYNASKAALQQWSDVLDSEIRRFGLRSVIIQPGGTQTGWQAIAYDRTDKNTSDDSPYKQLVDAVASVMNGVKIPASADDLAQVFYKAAADRKPKRRYYNSFGNHMYSWAARVFPGIMGMAAVTVINQKMKRQSNKICQMHG